MIAEASSLSLLRLIGYMAIAVALLWLLQIAVFSNGEAVVVRTFWLVGAALIGGAGTGLIFTTLSLFGSRSAEA